MSSQDTNADQAERKMADLPRPDLAQMETALREIMDDPRAGPWAQMRARCGLAVDL